MYRIKLYDALGRFVDTIDDIVAGYVEIKRKGLPGGLYFLQVLNNGQIVTSRKVLIR